MAPIVRPRYPSRDHVQSLGKVRDYEGLSALGKAGDVRLQPLQSDEVTIQHILKASALSSVRGASRGWQ